MKKQVIFLTKHEIQAGSNRQNNAEGIILQLPKDHNGRNTWLLNYGVREEALAMRKKHDLKWLSHAQAAESANARIERQALTQ